MPRPYEQSLYSDTLQRPASTLRPRAFPRAFPWALVLCSLSFFAFLNYPAELSTHERRVAGTALIMARSGPPWAAAPIEVFPPNLQSTHSLPQLEARHKLRVNPWLVPIYDNHPRLQKPPLPYWCAAVLYRITGATSPVIPRAIPALLGAASVFLIYALARALLDWRLGLFSALVFVSTWFIVSEFRKAMADPYLAFSTLAALYACVRLPKKVSGTFFAEKVPDTFFGRRRWPLVLLLYGSLAVGALSKGPLIFLHLALALVPFVLVFRRRPRLPWDRHALGLLLFLVITLPWPVYIVSHLPDALAYWQRESIGRVIEGGDHHPRPFYYYISAPLLMSFPWTPILILGLILLFRAPNRVMLFSAIWFALTVLVFSSISHKKNVYLLPVVTAQSLFIGRTLMFLVAALRRHAARNMKRDAWAPKFLAIQLALTLIFGLATSAITLIGPIEAPRRAPLSERFAIVTRQARAHLGTRRAPLALATLALTGIPFFMLRRPDPRTHILTLCYTSVALTALLVPSLDTSGQEPKLTPTTARIASSAAPPS